ncbi:MAG: dTDP-4-dehydrorhamnose reductase [Rheinheimera sp.]
MLKIGLFGGTGQLGRRLAIDLSRLGKVVAPNRQQLDLLDTSAVTQYLLIQHFDILVNAAAMTQVDEAETAIELSLQLNQSFVKQLANFAAANKVWLVHFSTDYVFDGSGDKPWCETDLCQPLQQYGQSKRAGELAIAKSGCLHLILRTSWLYDSQGHNFLLTMLRLAKLFVAPEQPDKPRSEPLQIVADQIGAPTNAAVLSQMVTQILRHLMVLPSRQADALSGIYHLCASDVCSWFEFAEFIFKEAATRGLIEQIPPLMPISSTELTRIAKRPLNSRLDTRKVQTTFHLSITSWQHQLQQCLDELKNAAKTGK